MNVFQEITHVLVKSHVSYMKMFWLNFQAFLKIQFRESDVMKQIIIEIFQRNLIHFDLRAKDFHLNIRAYIHIYLGRMFTSSLTRTFYESYTIFCLSDHTLAGQKHQYWLSLMSSNNRAPHYMLCFEGRTCTEGMIRLYTNNNSNWNQTCLVSIQIF